MSTTETDYKEGSFVKKILHSEVEKAENSIHTAKADSGPRSHLHHSDSAAENAKWLPNIM